MFWENGFLLVIKRLIISKNRFWKNGKNRGFQAYERVIKSKFFRALVSKAMQNGIE